MKMTPFCYLRSIGIDVLMDTTQITKGGIQKMKKLLALSFALALTFPATVCAAETVVPAKDLERIDTLAAGVDKSLPEYTSNAVSEIQGAEDITAVASGSDLIIAGEVTNATCIVDKVDLGAIAYARNKAAEVGGDMLATVKLSAPGVNHGDAQVVLAVAGVKAGDAVSVFKCVKGKWEAVDVMAVADGSVTIKFDVQGIYTLIG